MLSVMMQQVTSSFALERNVYWDSEILEVPNGLTVDPERLRR